MTVPKIATKLSKQFTPLKMGSIQLKHRVVMAPLTRVRSPGGIPTDVVREYYEQRASDGGLLISEGVHISFMAGSYPYVPGIYTPEQIRAWKKVTAGVHKKGGFIFAQLWHVGRTTHPINIAGLQPVSSSNVGLKESKIALTPKGAIDAVEPHALTIEEIQDTIADYAHAAKCAIEAGFDGVEVHGANGYLVDQFISSNINTRTDKYGGSPENRARFAIEVVDAIIAALGGESGRVGIRLSPFGIFQETETEDPIRDYGEVARQLDSRGLAFVHLVEIRTDLATASPAKLAVVKAKAAERGATDELTLKPFRRLLKNTLIIGNGTYISSGDDGEITVDPESRLEDGTVDAIAYGRFFISNPDLPERLRLGRPLEEYNRKLFYSHGPEGYTDYPAWEQSKLNPSAKKREVAQL
ncbi:hypothetical protein DFH27DRAFT_9574 [Peziza echinospora]|nr:hypothetical protein DFH27DRAFT_9574 [Peziza echinospora]